jgi:hypothetical protein
MHSPKEHRWSQAYLFNGLQAEIVDEIPLFTRDVLLSLMVGLADLDTAHQVAPTVLLLYNIHHRIQLVVIQTILLAVRQGLLETKQI